MFQAETKHRRRASSRRCEFNQRARRRHRFSLEMLEAHMLTGTWTALSHAARRESARWSYSPTAR